jgi:curved DNA-binding protein
MQEFIMDMNKDYYKIMGVTPNASEQEIKTAYRRLARKYHPDISKEPEAEMRFKEMGEAYETLKDSTKRTQYDNYLKHRASQEEAHHTSGGSQKTYYSYGNSPEFSSGEFDSDLFETLFGHTRYQSQTMAGQDYHGKITITLEEAFHGTIKAIQVPSQTDPNKSQVLNVKIPAGVKSGQQIRLSSQGATGIHGGPRGDLYITIAIEKHSLFEIKDNDIYLTLPITPWEAALGATITIPTLSGKIDLKIPASSQAGQKLRIKNRGLPGQTPGDQYVLLKIITPPATSDIAKDLYKKMAETMPFNPRESMGV